MLKKSFIQQILRDCSIYTRQLSESLMPTSLFLLMNTVFLILFSNHQELVKMVGPAIIWMSLLLSMLLSVDMIFKVDYANGIVEQMLLSPYPVYWLCLAKVIAQILIVGTPFLLLMPIVGYLFHFDAHTIRALVYTTALGIPMISLVAQFGAVLIGGLDRSSWLLPVLLLPLLLPVLLLGAKIILLAQGGELWQGPLLLLGALFMLTMSCMPWATGFVLKISVVS